MGFSVLRVARVGYIGARTCDNSRRGSPRSGESIPELRRGGEGASVGHLEPLAIRNYDKLTSLKV